MTVSWTQHRFSGGVLALDVANTVVLRGDAERGFDRFADPLEIGRFAEAATVFRAGELKGRALAAPEPSAIAGKVIAIREATDRLFRGAAGRGVLSADAMPAFLAACAGGLDGCRETFAADAPFGRSPQPLAFEAGLAVSALSLLAAETTARLRICPNCRWLFVDRSRNGSRQWCDMAVCGNRQKARRHYERRREALHG